MCQRGVELSVIRVGQLNSPSAWIGDICGSPVHMRLEHSGLRRHGLYSSQDEFRSQCRVSTALPGRLQVTMQGRPRRAAPTGVLMIMGTMTLPINHLLPAG